MEQLDAQARDNVPDARDNGPVKGYLSRIRAIIETMTVGRAPICPSQGCLEMDDNPSLTMPSHEVMWNSTQSNTLTSDDNLQD